MPISLYEEFVGIDWQHYSNIAGRVAVLSCFLFGLLDIFFRLSGLTALWCLFAGYILSIWEFPSLYTLIPKFNEVHDFVINSLQLKYSEGKAIVCLVLGVFCFTHIGFVLLAGIILLITTILYIFAAINRRADEAAGLRSDHNPSEYPEHNNRYGNPTQNLLAASSKFGTF